VLALLVADVAWANGQHGGHLHGKDAVRAYWTAQWQGIDPRVEPQDFRVLDDGRIAVSVHQVVRDLSGKVTSETMVRHVYTLRDGLVARMDIEHALA
jgi:hypothetical protein